jgi:hypothetical protein
VSWQAFASVLTIVLVVAALVQGVRAFMAGFPAPEDLGNEDDSIFSRGTYEPDDDS